MKASTPFVSLVGRSTATGRWLRVATAGAATATTPSFEYRQQSKDDPKLRKTCTTCGFVNYENPKVVCGSVLMAKAERSSSPSQVGDDGVSVATQDEDMFVLGRRTIHPRQGFWGIPAGFQEMGETGEEGAAREAREEMNAEIDVRGLLAVYCLPHIGQTQMIYSSALKSPGGSGGSIANNNVSAGQETDEVISVRWEDIPWEDLAFPTTSWALWHQRLRNEAAAKTFNGPAFGIPLGVTEGVQGLDLGRGPSAGVKARVVEEPHTVGIGNASLPQTGAGDARRGRLGVGVGVSEGTVFSTPATNSSLFWCPDRGLHLKAGWNFSADS